MNRIYAIVIFLVVSIGSTLAQQYYTDIDQSVKLAQKEDKNILMIFSGSDWCKPCIQLKKSILETDEFQLFSSQNLVVLQLDFPYSKKNKLSKEQTKHNEELADKYNSEGTFPKMILLDNSQESLGLVNYKKNYQTDDIIDQIKTLVN